MPGNTLFGEATQALSGASQTATAADEIKQKDRADSMRSGDEAAKRVSEQMDREENMIKVTPQLALGLVKNTGDKSWLQAVGQNMRADMYTALYTHGINTRIKSTPVTAMVGKNKVTFQPGFDDNGQIQMTQIASDEGAGQDIAQKKVDIAKENADTRKNNPPGSGKGRSTDDSEKWFKQAEGARKEIQATFNKKGGMPKSGKTHDIISFFQDGDPANDAKIAGLKQNYSDYRTAVDNYNLSAEKTGKSPISIDPSVSAAMDKIMALPGAKDGKAPDSHEEAKKWLEEHKLPVTDANVKHYLDNK